ncbi:aldehyde dehydrogenase family protein [Pusillimonas noertemannii]|uniref:Aldehyde dehydrogenase family protein n=1 Tax=Pusillimonas noertemannii TaxID=305977 RepID=A0A2U1CRF6_9BURK|nr:aldehyde dehydrogenase family protein [Pusillimonas noertemannii]NYT67807.1 aldehyde dehydrogenase family protein [Pusillimonas noertemannii]PVY68478.1 aldehyde dehydrogenase family protein [Pusillimonas noertemannii]TFL12044.1 aldehyde dehydrogenase family protein [Pusillimonas noertemannii]
MTKADLRERYAAMSLDDTLPSRRQLYYGGGWHEGEQGEAAHAGFSVWKNVPPFERGRTLREAARILRENALELAMIKEESLEELLEHTRLKNVNINLA